MDTLDRELIKHLQADGRLSLRELGRRLNVPHTTIFTRVNKLVEKGIIKNFSAVLHPHDLGFDLNFVLINPTSDPSELASSLAECEEVMKVFQTGDGKIIVKAVSEKEGPRCLDNFLSKLGDHEYTVYPVDDVVKYDHRLHNDFVDLMK